MPITHQLSRTPQGREILHMGLSGRLEGPEVEDIMSKLAPGGPYNGRYLLVTLERGTEFSPDARKGFAEGFKPGGRVGQVPAGIVTPNAALRVLVSFLARVTGSSDLARVFAVDADALKWLDEKLAAVSSSTAA